MTRLDFDFHSMNLVLLPEGDLALLGGVYRWDDNNVALGDVWIWSREEDDAWEQVATEAFAPRYGSTAALLPESLCVILGGTTSEACSSPAPSSVVYVTLYAQPENVIDGCVPVTVSFSEAVAGLNASGFHIVGGHVYTVERLNATDFTLWVVPAEFVATFSVQAYPNIVSPFGNTESDEVVVTLVQLVSDSVREGGLCVL
jgi:hypothetical protein